MTITEQQKEAEALQRATFLGLIDPFARAVRLNWPREGLLPKGKYGIWKIQKESLWLDMRLSNCGKLATNPNGYWSWSWSNTTARPTYTYHRTSAGRKIERLMRGRAGTLPKDLFDRTCVQLRKGIADYVKANNLELPPAYASILFHTA